MEEEDEVCVGDVLSAMAESVVESHSHLLVKNKPDRTSSAKRIQPKKPPPYIFYRRTLLFTTKIPEAVAVRTCTCMIECKPPGNPAMIKCLSCALFDAAGTGLFCEKCFKYSHPWHRAPHVFMSIDNDESLDYALKVAFRDQQIVRAEQEGADLRYMLQDENSKLEKLANELDVEDKIRDAGRRTLNLEDRLHDMRRRLQIDIDKKDKGKSYQTVSKSISAQSAIQAASSITNNGVPVPISGSISGSSFTTGFGTQQLLEKIQSRISANQNEEDVPHQMSVPPLPPDTAASVDSTSTGSRQPPLQLNWIGDDDKFHSAAGKLQKVFKGYQARKAVSLFFAQRIVRVYDAYSGRDYYYDKNTGMSSWAPPKLLRSWDVDRLEYLTETPQRTFWACKNRNIRRRDGVFVEDANDAAHIITSFFLCIKARKIVLTLADTIFRRVIDESDGSCYYWNIVTNESFWHKPKMFLTHEPPLYVDDDEAAATGTKRNLRSPRLNRERVAVATATATADEGMSLLTSTTTC